MVPFFAALLFAQPEPIRVTTRLVEVNVVVRNKNGPVPDLHAQDFTLRDRGRIQKISVFRAHSTRGDHPPSPLPPGEFTNRSYSDDASQQAIVIVWDRLNSYSEDAASGRAQVLKALAQIQPSDRVGLYTLDSKLHLIQDFTSDSAQLVEALRKYRESILEHSLDNVGDRMHSTGESAGPTSDGIIPMGSGMSNLAMMENIFAAGVSAGDRGGRSAMAVRAIANHLAGVPGRKSVIWITSEFPPAASAFINVGIAVYPVDLMGVIPPSAMRKDVRQLPERTLFERMVARDSGGVAFVDNDVRGAIDQAMKDTSVSYTLGFYPDRTPDRVNALKVEVLRKGLEVGYRGAYSGVVRPHNSDMAEALQSPLAATQISLNVRLRKTEDGWELALAIDPADLTFDAKNGRQSGGLRIALRQFSKDGTDLVSTSHSATLDFDPRQYREFLDKKHEMQFALPNPKPGLAALRLVVEDRVSGRVGSITIPVRD